MTTRSKPATVREINSNIIHVVFPQRDPDVSIFVPGVPVPNNKMYATAGTISDSRGMGRYGGRIHYRTDRTVAWIDAIIIAVRNALQHSPMRFTPPLHVVYAFNRVGGDAENYVKATSDGLKVAIGIDDKHFITTQKRVSEKRLPKGALIEIYNGPGGAA